MSAVIVEATEMMTIKNWKDVAELIALVAVVGSLIAVAVELRQTQAALQAQTYQERAFDAIQWHLEMAKSPELTPSGFFDGTMDISELDPTERETTQSQLNAVMIDADNEHYQYQRGFLDEEFYLRDTVVTIEMFAPYWRQIGIVESHPDFRLEVDMILGTQRGTDR